MSSSKDYLYYILDQLHDCKEISFLSMMGEYIIYYQGKIIGGIYDDRFLIKPTKIALELIKEPVYEVPYPGAKEMILIDNIEDKNFFKELLDLMVKELPMPKNKKK